MKNQISTKPTTFVTVLFSCAAILWSITRLFAWLVFSTATYAQALVAACRSVKLQEALDLEMMYNLINYPDEVSPNT